MKAEEANAGSDEAAGVFGMFQAMKKKGCVGCLKAFVSFLLNQASGALGIVMTAQIAVLLALCSYGQSQGVDTGYEIGLFSTAVAIQSLATMLSFAGMFLMVANFLVKRCGGDLSKIQWALPRVKVVLGAYMLGVTYRILVLPTYLFQKYDSDYGIMAIVYVIFSCALGQFIISLKLFLPGITLMFYKKVLKKAPPASAVKEAQGTVVEGDIELAEKNGATAKTPEEKDKRVIMIHTGVAIACFLCIILPVAIANGGYNKHLITYCAADEDGCAALETPSGKVYIGWETEDMPRECIPQPCLGKPFGDCKVAVISA